MLADRIGPLNTLIPITFLAALTALLWLTVHSLSHIIAWYLVYGFFSGSYVALTSVVWAALCPDLCRLGTRIGMNTVPVAVGLLIGEPVAGALVGGDGRDFNGLVVWCGVTVAAAGVFMVATRIAKTGFVVAVKV